ncbi:hypothetical protein [Saccharopolyspora hattusasensis]|uniref:hypothetical protein n=1 Tax=Saccharopolyspora hattusasensis TaxID=1128679 RepID=UPI003D99D563
MTTDDEALPIPNQAAEEDQVTSQTIADITARAHELYNETASRLAALRAEHPDVLGNHDEDDDEDQRAQANFGS